MPRPSFVYQILCSSQLRVLMSSCLSRIRPILLSPKPWRRESWCLISCAWGQIYHPDPVSRKTRTQGCQKWKGPKDLTIQKSRGLTSPQAQGPILPRVVRRKMRTQQTLNIPIPHILLFLPPCYEDWGGSYENGITITMIHQQQKFCGQISKMILGYLVSK